MATVLGLVMILALSLRAFRHPQPSATSVGLVILATVAVMTITNKTLSPQYLLWMGGPIAALLVLMRNAPEEQRAVIRRLSSQLLLLALLTHLVYPLFYDGLLGRLGPGMIVISTLVTTVRNLALVLFTADICRARPRLAYLSSAHSVFKRQSRPVPIAHSTCHYGPALARKSCRYQSGLLSGY